VILDTGAHLSALAADSEAVADLAEDHLDRPVRTCGNWTVADLLGHLGGVYSWAWLVVQAEGEKPDRDRDTPPAERAALVDWFRDERTAVIDALSSKEPEDPAWTFLRDATPNIGWWRRRQAMETAVHLYDVEEAAGRPGPVAPDLAADGVDEILTGFLPGYLRHVQVAGLEGTLHVHCTDADGEWVLDFSGPALEVRREHTKADTAVRGPASDLFLWLWNRLPLDSGGLEVFGRGDVAAALAEIRI
jgi:uncharacterized protein (TIGR03083 family)